MEDNEKNIKKGRPTKYQDSFVERAYELALLGLTDKAISISLDIDEATLNRWKHTHVDFCESLKRGREIADGKVVKSLYQRATGYQTREKKIEKDDQGKVIKSYEVIKQVPPDTGSLSLWLRNRRPKEWRDRQEIISKNVNYNIDDKDTIEASRVYQEVMGD